MMHGLKKHQKVSRLSYAVCKAHAPYNIVIVVCPALPYFSTFSHKWNDFGEKVIGHKLCALIFCTTFI